MTHTFLKSTGELVVSRQKPCGPGSYKVLMPEQLQVKNFTLLWVGGSTGWSVNLNSKNAICLIPHQGTFLGWGFNPQLGCILRQPINVSLSSLKKKSVNIFFDEDFLKCFAFNKYLGISQLMFLYTDILQ